MLKRNTPGKMVGIVAALALVCGGALVVSGGGSEDGPVVLTE